MSKRWLLLPLMVLAGAGTSLYSWAQSPSSATTDTAAKPVSNTVLGTETSLKTWQTAYFTTKYPDNLRVRTSSEDSSRAVIGNYMLSSVDTRTSDQLGITIVTMGNNTLESESAIRYRAQHPELYQRSSRSYAPANAYVFEGLGPDYEAGVFWQQGDWFIAVDVTGSTARRAELEQDLQAIVSNWQ